MATGWSELVSGRVQIPLWTGAFSLRTENCLNPIEKAWSKLKQLLRTVKARSKEALDQALTELLPQITPENASARFKHCSSGL